MIEDFLTPYSLLSKQASLGLNIKLLNQRLTLWPEQIPNPRNAVILKICKAIPSRSRTSGADAEQDITHMYKYRKR